MSRHIKRKINSEIRDASIWQKKPRTFGNFVQLDFNEHFIDNNSTHQTQFHIMVSDFYQLLTKEFSKFAQKLLNNLYIVCNLDVNIQASIWNLIRCLMKNHSTIVAFHGTELSIDIYEFDSSSVHGSTLLLLFGPQEKSENEWIHLWMWYIA